MLKIRKFEIEYSHEPINIACEHPRFFWQTEQGSAVQKSYRILVSSKADFSDAGLWDSGEVVSRESVGIVYQGKALGSQKVYFVRLMLVGENGDREVYDSRFETALMSQSDWKGKWVGIPCNFNGGTLYFRKKILLGDKKVCRARAYICGIGYHEFYINGKKISDYVLNPGVTDYSKEVLYDVYDITKNANEKEIVVGIEVGYGWYGSRKMLAQFYFEFDDGTVLEDFSTCNHGWWVSGSPVIENSIYGGEVYDARIEEACPKGWASPDFEPAWDNGWMYTILTQAPSGKLVPQKIEPIKVFGEFKGRILRQQSKNITVYDIGQNIAGWAKIRVKGKRGARVIMRFSEGINDDNTVNRLNLRSAKCIDQYILKGGDIEQYAPRFTFHGFQYVEVETDGDVEVLELIGQHVHTATEKTGEFECSDADLNQLHKNAVITEENNQHSIFSDCPQRDERFGWLNDLTSRLYQVAYNFKVDKLIEKVASDIVNTQDEMGRIADTVPYYTGGQPADTTAVSFLLLALANYKYYGDLQLAKKYYANYKAWTDYLLTRQKDYVMDYYYYADWVVPFPDDNKTDSIFVSSMFLYWHLVAMSQIAEIAGEKKDKEKYQKHAGQARKALNSKYYNAKTNNYGAGTQTENSMAVSLGLAENDDIAAIVKNIADDIVARNYHCTSGNQGYRHVFYVLSEYGYTDLLIKMIKNREYPGWGYMLECGATTVWERWESTIENVMYSRNHPMFGSYDAWFYRYLGGISIGGFGADKIKICPIIPDSISYVKSSFESVRGKIVSNWEKVDGGVRYNVEIPVSVNAEIALQGKIVSVNGKKYEGDGLLVLDGGCYNIETSNA